MALKVSRHKAEVQELQVAAGREDHVVELQTHRV